METPPFGGRDVCSAVGGVKVSSISQVMIELVGMDELAEMVELTELAEPAELVEMIPHRLIFCNSL